MRVVVIGATGHIGGYLIPRLVGAGYEVVAMSRGMRDPYRTDPAWESVERVVVDRETADAAGTFGSLVASFDADIVIDLICFTMESAGQLVEALRGRTGLLVSCGSLWVHGPAAERPTKEDEPRDPVGAYGIAKAQIEAMLLAESGRPDGLASIVLHPGHITGPGWSPIGPTGNLDPTVWTRLAAGDPVALPHFGLETVHHVHADDVAQGFQRAIENGKDAAGHSFHIVSERAITLRAYAEAVAGWSGRTADLRFVPFDEFRRMVGDVNAELTLDHISRSPSASIDKAKRMLGYTPRFTSLEAIADAHGVR